jgi:hypothetical protein
MSNKQAHDNGDSNQNNKMIIFRIISEVPNLDPGSFKANSQICLFSDTSSSCLFLSKVPDFRVLIHLIIWYSDRYVFIHLICALTYMKVTHSDDKKTEIISGFFSRWDWDAWHGDPEGIWIVQTAWKNTNSPISLPNKTWIWDSRGIKLAYLHVCCRHIVVAKKGQRGASP